MTQTDDGPFKASMSSFPPPLDEALHQGSTYRHFRKKANDRLKAHFSDVNPCFGNVLIGASLTSIRG